MNFFCSNVIFDILLFLFFSLYIYFFNSSSIFQKENVGVSVAKSLKFTPFLNISAFVHLSRVSSISFSQLLQKTKIIP